MGPTGGIITVNSPWGVAKPLEKLGRSARNELLVNLGQLPRQNNWSINQKYQFFKGFTELVRGLEEHHQALSWMPQPAR